MIAVFIPQNAVNAELQISINNFISALTGYYHAVLENGFLLENQDDVLKLLQLCKSVKCSRFRQVQSSNEAKSFLKLCSAKLLSNGDENVGVGVAVVGSEQKEKAPEVNKEKSLFHTPKPFEFLALRKAILSDDAKSFRSLVFSNPHFLVTSSDTCTILHDGARYNALHLCAQKNRKLVALTLIKTISSNEFWQLIYPHDSDCSRMNRMNYMLDMYLNTPDKHCGETALHFAAKFGFNSMLELLASHPRTIRNTVNSNNLKPGQVAGVRCSGFAPKFKIDQGPFYVCCSVCDSDLSMFKFVVSGPKSPSDNFELGSTQARKVKDLVTLETDFVTDAYIGPTFEVKSKAIQNDLNKLKRSILTSSDSKLGKYLKYRIGRLKICNEHKVRLKERFLISDTFLEISEEFILGILKRCELFLQRENNSFFATSDHLESFACFNTTSCQANNSLADSSLGSLTSSFANLNLNASFQRSFNLNDSLMPGINEISEALMRANESLNNISDLDLINDGQNASSCSENNDDPDDFKTPPGSPDLSFVDAINSPFISFCNCKATDFWDQSNNLLVLNNHLVCQYFDILRQTDHFECELFPFMQVWTENFKLYSKDMLADKRVKVSMHCKSCSFCPNDIDVRFSEFVSLSDFEFDPFCLNLT